MGARNVSVAGGVADRDRVQDLAHPPGLRLGLDVVAVDDEVVVGADAVSTLDTCPNPPPWR